MFERLKNLRGILYKKIAESENEEPLPGFRMEKSSKIVEFPDVDDITKVNMIYPIMEPFSYVNIKWDPENKELLYSVIEPILTKDEKKAYDKISDALIQLVEVELTALKDINKAVEYLQRQINKVLKDFGMQLTQNQYLKIMYFIYRDFLGYNELNTFMQDPNIEDISCDGTDIPIFIVHRKYGSIKTNMSFTDADKLREFVIKLAERCGRYVSYAEPILDGTLPDGSRVSASVAGDVTTRGPTMTIRKFGEKPLSPIEQIDLHTTDSQIMAYFWYIVEHGANILFVGGTATGKTTFLNSVCMFIPPEKKIVSIEDTREIKIPHQHWISGLARTGFGIPMPSGEKYGEVTMFDLLRESFRQNPDYVIVGETRGQEAYVMFQGMASGHTSLSTFHANSVDAVVKRLTSPPIELSPTLIESLNVMVIMAHAREIDKSARRVKEVVEIISVDAKTEEVKTNLVYLWSPSTDSFTKLNDSQIIQRIVEAKGGRIEDINGELERRKNFLDWLKAKRITDFIEVTNYINMYYKEPEKVSELIGTPVVIKEEPKRVPVKIPQTQKVPVAEPMKIETKTSGRTSILSLLGMKVLKEKH